MKKKALIIDVSNLFFRAFFAVPQSFTAPDGSPCNAIYGVVSTLFTMLERERPDALYAARDMRGPTLRHEKLDSYKEGRPEMPDMLRSQLPKIYDFFSSGLGVPVLGQEGYEADDFIGTMTDALRGEYEVAILSADRDLLQLVDETTTVLVPKGKEYLICTPEMVMELMGVRPDQIADYKGLAGDSSDKLVGVPGIGPKGASQLLQRYGSLLEILLAAERGELPGKMGPKILEHRESALQCYELAHLHRDLPLPEGIVERGLLPQEMPPSLPDFLAQISTRRLLSRAQKIWGQPVAVASDQAGLF